jgi:hypothetical protein
MQESILMDRCQGSHLADTAANIHLQNGRPSSNGFDDQTLMAEVGASWSRNGFIGKLSMRGLLSGLMPC